MGVALTRFQATALGLMLGLSGCAGGGFAPNATLAGSTDSSVRAKTVLSAFVIRIPRRKHRTGRAPAYVSEATKAVGITVDPGSHQVVLNANVTPGSAGCSGNTCTLMIALAAGAHRFDIRTYDQPLHNGVPTGQVLSANVGFPFTVRAGKANTIRTALQGIPKSIAVTQIPDDDVAGSQQSGFSLYGAYEADGSTIFPRVFTVASLDADGNYIVGAGAPKLSMSSSATSVLSNGVASTSAPNRFVVTPAATWDTRWVPFTMTATPQSGAGASAVSTKLTLQIVARNAPRIYVTDQTTPPAGKLWVFDENGKPVAGVQSNIDASGSLDGPIGVTYCPTLDMLFVAAEFSGTIYGFASSGTSNTSYGTGKTPLSIYCDDSAGRLYVGNENDVVTILSANSLHVTFATSGTWKEGGSGAVPVNPWGVLVKDGKVLVADPATGGGVLAIYDEDGNAQTDFAGPYWGLADVSGTIYYTERGLDAVSGVTAPGAFPNLHGPFGVRQDPANGYVYVVNYYSTATATPTVTRYQPNGDQVALSAGAFSGPQTPDDIEIVP